MKKRKKKGTEICFKVPEFHISTEKKCGIVDTATSLCCDRYVEAPYICRKLILSHSIIYELHIYTTLTMI